ncbi:protein of unknown function [Rhodovastum atsumiense]|nr:protein of unknown function [Rhodovastum atsumiense]
MLDIYFNILLQIIVFDRMCARVRQAGGAGRCLARDRLLFGIILFTK